MNSSSSASSRSRSSKRGTSRLAKIKCSFCGNIFYAAPREAVCRKCNRPANRPLALHWRVLSLVLPPLGLGYSLFIRSHSPFSSNQGLIFSLVGALVHGGLFALLRA